MRALVTGAVALLAFATAAAAQTPAPPPDTAELTAQLERLNRTLERIADSLNRQSKLDLVVRRIELGADRVAALEKKLDAARAERGSLENERDRMIERKDSVRREVEEGLVEATADQLDVATAQMDAEIRRILERLRELGGQIADLENRLTEQRTEHEEWQAYLDKLIDAL